MAAVVVATAVVVVVAVAPCPADRVWSGQWPTRWGGGGGSPGVEVTVKVCWVPPANTPSRGRDALRASNSRHVRVRHSCGREGDW